MAFIVLVDLGYYDVVEVLFEDEFYLPFFGIMECM